MTTSIQLHVSSIQLYVTRNISSGGTFGGTSKVFSNGRTRKVLILLAFHRLDQTRSTGFQDRLVMTTSIHLRISILFYSQARLQEKRARNATYAIIEKSVNPYCLKVLRWMSRSVIWNISRPPRYDHFDTAPYITIRTVFYFIRRDFSTIIWAFATFEPKTMYHK